MIDWTVFSKYSIFQAQRFGTCPCDLPCPIKNEWNNARRGFKLACPRALMEDRAGMLLHEKGIPWVATVPSRKEVGIWRRPKSDPQHDAKTR